MENVQKFTGRASDYAVGRPFYSMQLIEFLYKHYINDKSVIADIGCGTGKFTKQLLDKGNFVYGVEPNKDMQSVALKELAEYKNFKLINGTAENTNIKPCSVDFITVAQAFHWFDADEFHKECKRILKPNGYVALIWNTRDISAPLNKDSYDIYKKYCFEFKGFGGGVADDSSNIKQFFDNEYKYIEFNNTLEFTKDKFIKRSLSASYSIKQDNVCFMDYKRELEEIFDKYADTGKLIMPNKTVAYIGKCK